MKDQTLCIDTFSGSPREIGRAWGHAYRHLIQALFWEGNAYHRPHAVEAELDELTERAMAKLRAHAPDYLIEMEAAAGECGLTLQQMVLRADGFVYQRGPHRRPPTACFQVGIQSEPQGPIVGSIMDSARVCFAWWRIRPQRGYAHLALTIPGTAMSGRGMNEAGLVVSESSTPHAGADYEPDLLLHTLATRRVLEECRTVQEAIDLMTALPVSHTYVFADAAGDLRGLQTTPAGHTVYETDDNAIVFANHVRDRDLLAKMIARGYSPEYRNADSELRVSTAEALLRDHDGPRDFDLVKSILSSHIGYPDSICRDDNASTFIGMPVADAQHLYIAERFPCSQPFVKYAVLA
jgi:hypothetical protein